MIRHIDFQGTGLSFSVFCANTSTQKTAQNVFYRNTTLSLIKKKNGKPTLSQRKVKPRCTRHAQGEGDALPDLKKKQENVNYRMYMMHRTRKKI